MQRIIVQLVGAGEQFVKQGILALDVTYEQSLGELVLVFEMIEEAASRASCPSQNWHARSGFPG